MLHKIALEQIAAWQGEGNLFVTGDELEFFGAENPEQVTLALSRLKALSLIRSRLFVVEINGQTEFQELRLSAAAREQLLPEDRSSK